MNSESPLLRVMSLHALGYCERLFYLEEVEEIRVADANVYAGRTLHERIADDDSVIESITLENERWGIRGKADYVRYRDGRLVVYEHKKGRAPGGGAWPSDRLQLIAYAALVSDHFGTSITEGRIRYHASNRTVRIAIGPAEYDDLRKAVVRARELSYSTTRPPIAENDRLCAKCSLAPVCLPEEERLARAVGSEEQRPVRLFPEDDERLTLHVTEPRARVGRSGEEIVVSRGPDDEVRFAGRDVSAIVLHGGAQITTQLVHFAVAHDIAIHWLTGGGNYVAGVMQPGGVQRRIRQFTALVDDALRRELARRLAVAKIENQMKFLMRNGRDKMASEEREKTLRGIRAELRGVERSETTDEIRGHEGMAARVYFAALASLISADNGLMRFSGRNRRPPRDPFNAALSFGYSLLYRDLVAAALSVGLDPSFGFFHAARSAAYPLALDLMELFRTMVWEMPLIAAVNRGQWTEEHFERARDQVWLSAPGRGLAIEIYEARKRERWKHPVLGYSLSYGRTMELEARLLEKEWSGAPGLFARMRIRG